MTLDREHIITVQKLYATSSAGEALDQLMKEQRELCDVLNDICSTHQDVISVDMLKRADAALKAAAHTGL